MIVDRIVRARRRYLRNELLAQGAYAASVGMAGVVLLLIAGTQILDWRVLAAVWIGTLVLGTYRTLRRVPSVYAVAQLVDRRLMLADTLSTALYFSGNDAAARVTGASESMRRCQQEQAERAAANVSIERAIPFVMPRATYALAALGLAASGLFALRYGLTRRLDLQAPLARIMTQNLGFFGAREVAAARKIPQPKRTDGPKPAGLSLPEGDVNQPGELDAAPDSVLDTTGIPNEVNQPLGQAQSNSKTTSESSGSEKTEGEQGDGESSESADASAAASAKDNPEGGQKGNQSGAANAGNSSQSSSDQNGSLVAKLRDAMSNLLSRMRQQGNGSGSQKQSSTGQNARQTGAQRSGQQNGAAGKGQQPPGAQESADAESQQSGTEGKDGQSSQAKGNGRSADQQGSNQPGSGVGKQDGNKDAHLAEQLAAMGKISEIIGKRSANVTGEITVEVPSSQQQLRTGFTRSNATHTDAGGDITRDEVPVIFQQYVQQYFEQVRKQADRRGEPLTRSKAQSPASKSQPPSL